MHRFRTTLIVIWHQTLSTIRSLGRLVTIILLLSLCAIWILFAGIFYESYRNEWQSATQFVNNIDSLLAADLSRNLESYDLLLKFAGVAFADPEVAGLPANIKQRLLFSQSTNVSGLGAVMIFDKTGMTFADSRPHVADHPDVANRDFFRVHEDGQYADRLFISHPFQGRVNPDIWALGLSRRLDNPDGSFAGVVLGTLRLDHLAQMFGAVSMPPDSTITLVHDDGTILMRVPSMNIGLDTKSSPVFHKIEAARSGVMVETSPIDHVERLFAFRRIGALPVMLIIGIPTSRFVDGLRLRLGVIALGFTILSGLILFLALALGTQLQRRGLAEKALSELAATDSLTGLANRRCFDEVLENEWARAIRDGTSLALLMVDGDFFKAYNDTYGHLEGDQVLRAIAGALRDSVQRPADHVARFGGEEFAILLPGADIDGALVIGAVVRDAIARLDRRHARSPFGRVTVSIGAAACLPEDPGMALSLVQAADFALYEAKENGRDQTATGERLDLPSFGWRAVARPLAS